MAEDVAVPVHDASLPSGFGKELGCTLAQPQTSIRDDQADAGETTFLEVLEERARGYERPSRTRQGDSVLHREWTEKGYRVLGCTLREDAGGED
jgi:hypothetical protein